MLLGPLERVCRDGWHLHDKAVFVFHLAVDFDLEAEPKLEKDTGGCETALTKSSA
jgi:hypothetical protein